MFARIWKTNYLCINLRATALLRNAHKRDCSTRKPPASRRAPHRAHFGAAAAGRPGAREPEGRRGDESAEGRRGRQAGGGQATASSQEGTARAKGGTGHARFIRLRLGGDGQPQDDQTTDRRPCRKSARARGRRPENRLPTKALENPF